MVEAEMAHLQKRKRILQILNCYVHLLQTVLVCSWEDFYKTLFQDIEQSGYVT